GDLGPGAGEWAGLGARPDRRLPAGAAALRRGPVPPGGAGVCVPARRREGQGASSFALGGVGCAAGGLWADRGGNRRSLGGIYPLAIYAAGRPGLVVLRAGGSRDLSGCRALAGAGGVRATLLAAARGRLCAVPRLAGIAAPVRARCGAGRCALGRRGHGAGLVLRTDGPLERAG